MKILVIEDDGVIHDTLVDNLTFEGYEVDSAYDGEAGYKLSLENQYDLILLDLMLPFIKGMDILKNIRKKHIDTPVIILTANNEEHTKLEGFRVGADDYVCKPFSLPVLIARIKAISRRNVATEKVTNITIGKGFFDFDKYIFKINNREEECAKYEILILKLLSSKPGKVFSRDEILHYAWGADVFPTDRTVDNYILKLRKKLGACIDIPPAKILETVYGVGYRLNI